LSPKETKHICLEKYRELTTYHKLIELLRKAVGWRKIRIRKMLKDRPKVASIEEALDALREWAEQTRSPFYKRLVKVYWTYLGNPDKGSYDPLVFGLTELFAEKAGESLCSLLMLARKMPVEDIRIGVAETVEPVRIWNFLVLPCAPRKGKFVCWQTKVNEYKVLNVKPPEYLRDYQKEPFVKTISALLQLKGAILKAPTGFGKTVVGSAVMEYLISEGKIKKATVIVPLSVLKSQWEESIGKFCPSCEGKVIVTTYQKLYWWLKFKKIQPRRLLSSMILSDALYIGEEYEEIDVEEDLTHYLRSDLVIFDEVHTAKAKSLAFVLDANKKALRLGLSATPEWTNSLTRFSMLELLVGRVVEGPTTIDLIRRGVLSKLTYEMVDLDVECRSDNPLACISQSQDEIVRVVKEAVERHRGKKIAILVPLISLCKRIAEEIGIVCAYSENSDVLDELRKADKGVYVATTPLIQMGYDDPKLEVLIIADVISNEHRLKQIIGRLLRKAEGKEVAKIVDICLKPFKEACEKRREVYESLRVEEL